MPMDQWQLVQDRKENIVGSPQYKYRDKRKELFAARPNLARTLRKAFTQMFIGSARFGMDPSDTSDRQNGLQSQFKEELIERRFAVEDPKRIKSRVLRWIAQKVKLAVEGDAIIIILCGHGNERTRHFRLKVEPLLSDEFVKAISPFKAEVQVNTVYNDCYFGWFHDKIEDAAESNNQRRLVHVATTSTEPAVGDTLFDKSLSTDSRPLTLDFCVDPSVSKTTKTPKLTKSRATPLREKQIKSSMQKNPEGVYIVEDRIESNQARLAG
ncbi:MAG: hypothetical protein HETSPECPRED_006834 [Heterodermia speciosa]|uniref:Uncharacterized protein n=1 Tax=Heterodermia speciosa TaxID=116794 RepID=A0A8H3FNU9_9LECA|nr:MAG: hypothetical protein HETSPECPRED_006834 [Heterodermia speciosa]